MNLIDIILHLDVHLNEWLNMFGPGIYLILFLIIFCETGLVVMPILPGDSLLFALGAFAATENSVLKIEYLAVILIVAAIFGDTVNYAIGKYFGQQIINWNTRFLKREHVEKTQKFYEKHGGKTIVLARFLPIIRTFAPFVAGVGRMHYPHFIIYNVVGGIVWVLSFLVLGYNFGNMPVIKDNFHIVIVVIIVLSILPGIIEYIRAKRNAS